MRARWSRQGRAAPDGLPPSGQCSRHEIDNAVDATLAAPAPRRVTVTVRQDEAELLVRVADTGPGLDAAALEQVFTRGWSTKPTGRPQGRGLGLALVRQVVTRHDGSIQVANDSGAVFTIRLPLPTPVEHTT